MYRTKAGDVAGGGLLAGADIEEVDILPVRVSHDRLCLLRIDKVGARFLSHLSRSTFGPLERGWRRRWKVNAARPGLQLEAGELPTHRAVLQGDDSLEAHFAQSGRANDAACSAGTVDDY